ncbi:MAG: hypothetical protein IV090_00710 [Candidatus Sericytochromatia bacterium]|nr:hypothetical protein [Candidatus Sericytochromatia bacterium]
MRFKHINNLLLSGLIMGGTSLAMPVFAHNGVDHGSIKHRQVEGTDVLFEMHTQSEFKKIALGAQPFQGSHILVVHLMQNKQRVNNAQIKIKLIGPDQKTIGSESGQNMGKVTLKNKLQNFATGFDLNKKGKYIAVILFKTNNKLAQTSFEFHL